MKTKNKFGIKDIVTVAAMMVLFFGVSMIIGMVALPIPIVYLYGTAGIEMFIGAIFYLVAANRVNKHGLLFVWATVYGIINGVMGYTFMTLYFVIVGIIAELAMLGKDTYRNPLRNMIGWDIYSIGMVVGIAMPIWAAWDSYKKMALSGGFSLETLKMQYNMVTRPELMLVAIIVTVILSSLGILFGQKLLKKHFKKAGIVG
ncbi:Trep_Strep domain-containing protein [Clostridium niameyense]|uniref:Trep_Strep domain-containing protein n=1 Tax=Clostridium niameyense TaxID=1622073 RepID=A0A6M0RDB2_9CLOT|nr:MptD family putative ECF transporter S component [Clostridium niameyense]NEZ47268.1 Trep_Strep domain-containing protein [Clostridium niameyense]